MRCKSYLITFQLIGTNTSSYVTLYVRYLSGCNIYRHINSYSGTLLRIFRPHADWENRLLKPQKKFHALQHRLPVSFLHNDWKDMTQNDWETIRISLIRQFLTSSAWAQELHTCKFLIFLTRWVHVYHFRINWNLHLYNFIINWKFIPISSYGNVFSHTILNLLVWALIPEVFWLHFVCYIC